MTADSDPPRGDEPLTHFRWSRTEESAAFFLDEDRLRRVFYFLASFGAVLLGVLAAGLWKLNRAALTPAVIVGISNGLVFTGRPEGIASVRAGDFDSQLADTVEVLFSRTEKGLPPEIREFCRPEVVAQVDGAYRENEHKFPAGYVQTMTVAETRLTESRIGYRRVRYRGLLSSRSVSAAQTSPIFLDCVFAVQAPTPLNAAGWRLVRVEAMSREDFYRSEREKEVRSILNLPP